MFSTQYAPFISYPPRSGHAPFPSPESSVVCSGLPKHAEPHKLHKIGESKPERALPYWNCLTVAGRGNTLFSGGNTVYCINPNDAVVPVFRSATEDTVEVMGNYENNSAVLVRGIGGSVTCLGIVADGSISPASSIPSSKSCRIGLSPTSAQGLHEKCAASIWRSEYTLNGSSCSSMSIPKWMNSRDEKV